MRKNLLSISLLILCQSWLYTSAHAAPVVAYTYTENADSFLSTATATVGFEFTTTTRISLTALGIIDTGTPGLEISHEAGLWSIDGTLLASATIPAGTTTASINGFRFVGLPTPVTLESGETFRVAVVIIQGSDVHLELLTRTSDPEIILQNEGYNISNPGSTLTFPTTNSLPESAIANFLYETVGTNTADACGNAIADSAEQCDGPDFNSQSCVTLGFAGGVLGCSVACTLDTSLCSN